MNRELTTPNKPNVETNGMSVDASTKESLRELICGSVISECTRTLDGRLKAIVLTGSLARDEASFARTANGWELHGDAEFLVVMKEGCGRPSIPDSDQIRQQIVRNLESKGLRGTVDVGFLRPFFFARLPEHIFSYELKHCGRVVWGDAGVLGAIPDFPASYLSREDAWRLLTNRLVEILECAPEMTQPAATASSNLQYRLVKLHLDTATSLSVFLNLYQPSYRGRMEALANLAAENHDWKIPFDIPVFNDRLERSTTAKLSFPARLAECSGIEWRDSLRSALSVWRWELVRLTGASEALSGAELFETYRRRQLYSERLRGWLYVARACGWHRSYHLWPRWLRMSGRMSPRYWIYSLTGRALEEATKSDTAFDANDTTLFFEALRHELPVPNEPVSPANQPAFLALAAEIVWNYKQFVVGTRA
ncbi:MAG: hypothetical protein WA209_11925 [Candidatus Acidiferrales bacterium]